MRIARTIFTGFVVLFALAVISGCGSGSPNVSGQWKGSVEINGEPAGLKINLNTAEAQGNGRSINGNGNVTLIEEGDERDYPLNIKSGGISRGGNLNFTTGANSGLPPMTFQASAGSSRIQGNVVIDSGDVSGGPLELARGKDGKRILTGTLERAKKERQQQQAAQSVEELDNRLGGLLYGAGEGSDNPQSVESTIGTVESNATALRDKLKSTIKDDTEERESESKDVREVLEDYRDGETSTEEACFDIRYDRSDFSQSDTISDDSVEEYRRARDELKKSEQKLDELMGKAKDTLKELEAAQENAPGAPPPSYGEGDVERLQQEVKEAHKKADSALKETRSKRKEYEKRAQEASDRAVDAFDEIGIKDDASCFNPPEETTTERTQDGQESSSETDEDNETTTSRTQSGSPSGTQSPEETLALQYEHVNQEGYRSAYELFADQSQQRVSFEQYRSFFEDLGFYRTEDPLFLSTRVNEDRATVNVMFTIVTPAGGELLQRTQRMVLEDEDWRIVMREDQISSFTEGEASFLNDQ